MRFRAGLAKLCLQRVQDAGTMERRHSPEIPEHVPGEAECIYAYIIAYAIGPVNLPHTGTGVPRGVKGSGRVRSLNFA